MLSARRGNPPRAFGRHAATQGNPVDSTHWNSICFGKRESSRSLGASLFRDTAFGKTNKGTIDVIRASENYLVPNVRGYDVTQDYQQVDDRRWR